MYFINNINNLFIVKIHRFVKELKILVFIYYCGDQFSLEYCLGLMDWACDPMTQSKDTNISEDGQLG